VRLADDITIVIAGEEITLRPSLHHAIRLERREGSFQKLLRDIMDGSLTAACDVIRDHTVLDFLENRILDALPDLKAPLLQYVMQCAGVDGDDAPAKGGKPAKSVPFREYLQQQYKVATGWLGWSPETALDATPAEIQLAYEGRLDMLKAIFGSTENKTSPDADMPLDAKFKGIFGGLGTVKEAA
jgi:hypothetical protein